VLFVFNTKKEIDMSTVLERELKKLVAVLQVQTENQTRYERWMTQAIFMQRTGKTEYECESFRRAHPDLVLWEKSDSSDKRGRVIRRNPLYDYEGFLNLHKPAA